MTAEPHNVLVLGAASWNRMVYVDALPQGRSTTLFNASEREGVGSTGAGKAMALAELSYKPVLQCVLGDDPHGRQVQAACAERGIEMLVDVQTDPTPHHLNIMDRAGGRYSLFLSNGPDHPALDLDRAANAIRGADTIFLSLAQSSRKLLLLLGRTKAEILLDLHDYDGANPWYDAFIEHADVIQLSDVALPKPEPVVAKLLSGRAHTIVVTHAEKGASIHRREGNTYVPPCFAQMQDSNGAGDAFSVALWHALRVGFSLTDAGRFAAAAAAFAIEDWALFPARVGPDAILKRAALPRQS
ncbi:carbohydrate kinase family protein [Gymnodinialimonas hymeniacidonis]|uniref:carbohydrate kinase family protein n=1 Tax=Gymnodinialimonas hymeniacidonis TaxID=3126508 RepID=UPI0034C5FE9F